MISNTLYYPIIVFNYSKEIAVLQNMQFQVLKTFSKSTLI